MNSDEFLHRAAKQGARVREYAPPNGGQVECTVTAEDDILIGRLAVVMLIGVIVTIGWVIVAGAFAFSPAQAFDFPPEARSLNWTP